MFIKVLISSVIFLLSFSLYGNSNDKESTIKNEKNILTISEERKEATELEKKQMLKEITQLEGDTTPKWVKKQGRYGAFILDGKMLIDSVGISKDLKDDSRTYKESTKNAREDLSLIIKLYVKALHDSYNKSIKIDNIPQEEIDKNMNLILGKIKKSRFSGAQVIDRWISKDKAVLTLLEIDLGQVVDMVKVTKGVTTPFLKKLDFHSKEAYKSLNIRLKPKTSNKK